MTVFTRTWNAAYMAQPADGENINLGATRIRNGRVDVQERMAVDHSWAGDAEDGKHVKVTFRVQAIAPTLDPTDGALYTGPAGGRSELFYKDDLGGITRLTNAGFNNGSFNDVTIAGDLAVGDDITAGGSIGAAGDAQFYLDKSGANPFLNVDTNSYILYDRGVGEFYLFANAVAASLNIGSLVATTINVTTANIATASISVVADAPKFRVDSEFYMTADANFGGDPYIQMDMGGALVYNRALNRFEFYANGVLALTVP